ncbi:hypothetical protein Hgul01_05280 [Herpetosiphon gulosus]|uniref:Uncharacterized protein n=2 Tax=Herpetosiphon gulosus TaxID=1973496 RepID=A0ABP9X7U5_9CHLR
MVRIVITGKTQGDVVRAITEMREGLGRRVDFGLPLEDEYQEWASHGYQLAQSEFEQCQQSGNWPTIDFYGKVE